MVRGKRVAISSVRFSYFPFSFYSFVFVLNFDFVLAISVCFVGHSALISSLQGQDVFDHQEVFRHNSLNDGTLDLSHVFDHRHATKMNIFRAEHVKYEPKTSHN